MHDINSKEYFLEGLQTVEDMLKATLAHGGLYGTELMHVFQKRWEITVKREKDDLWVGTIKSPQAPLFYRSGETQGKTGSAVLHRILAELSECRAELTREIRSTA